MLHNLAATRLLDMDPPSQLTGEWLVALGLLAFPLALWGPRPPRDP